LLLLAFVALTGAEPDRAVEPDLVYEEQLLRSVGVTPDGPGLVEFFRSKALSAEEQQRLAAAIPLMGSESYETREKATRDLIAAGRFAVPYLKAALKSDDLEIARRADRCLSAIDQIPYANLMTAAARVAAVRRPEGITEVILGCLPWAEDEAIEEALFAALLKTALKDGVADPALTAAVSDKEPTRRAAAAFVLGQAGPRYRQQSRQLLGDASAKVRFQAASSLLQAGEREAVPALLALLTDGPVTVTWRAEDVLTRLTSESDAPLPSAGRDAESRRRARAAWEAWWKEKGDKVDLDRLKQAEAMLGLNVITELDGGARPGVAGKVWECGVDGKPRWQIENIQRPIDAQVIPGGRVLVAEHGLARVTERDRAGNILWEHKTAALPVSCQRLGNGNTVIATYSELLEVTRDNKVVFNHKVTGAQLYYGQKLRNGHYLCALSNNRLLELDDRGKAVLTVNLPNSSGWSSVEKLTNTHYLVALYSANKVVEVDPAGRVTWELAVRNPGHATRLRNGNTLVASISGQYVAEFNREGKEVWKQVTPGRPFHVYRR
jgi:HEAT repeat protein